jgi:hypothetical protein
VFAERCSAAILDGRPDKMGEPGVPTISYLIGTLKFDQALCDLGASVSIMSKVIYDQLNHDSLVPTSMHLQLADQSIWCPVGVVEDISVNQEFFCTHRFRGTRDGCLSSDIAYS